MGTARLTGAQPTGPVRPVTFPTARLVTRVLVALGADLTASPATWAWEDITRFVRQDLGISQTVGRPDGSTRVNYGRATLKLDNRDGRFTRRNPNGPYYGLLSGNTPIWITVDAGSGVRDRIQMFVNDWPTRWSDKSATDSTVTIQCAGALRRLNQGKPLRSALRRSLERSTAVLSYWPLEDGANSTQAASGLPGGTPLLLSGSAPGFATASAPAGSSPVVDFATGGGSLSGAGRAPSATPTAMRLQMLMKFATGGDASTLRTLMEWTTVGGTYTTWRMTISAGNLLQVEGFGAAGATTGIMDSNLLTTIYTGDWYRVEVGQRYGDSGNLITYLDLDSFTHATGPNSPPFGVGETFGYISAINVNPLGYSGTFMPAIGHLTVVQQDVDFALTDPMAADPAMSGYVGEQAHVRLARLCAEEGVPFVCLADRSVAMGPQSTTKFVDLLGDCEAVDQGALFETAWGLGYQSVAERTNAAVGLALDFDLGQIGQIPEPADDDQRLRNFVTASRSGGSEATSEQLTGPLRTSAGGPGVYEDSITVNVQTDAQLADAAGWRKHLGTVDEDRWPSISINLARSPELIDTWTALPYGSRMTASNPPSQMPPDTIDAIIEGFTEAWDPYNWIATLATSPFSPYRTGTLAADSGDTTGTRLILTPDTLILAADVSTTDVTWSVNSSPLWTTNAEYFPRYIWWEGEVVQLTNCVGGSAPQTWTVVRSINGVVKGHLANSSGSVYRPGVLALV